MSKEPEPKSRKAWAVVSLLAWAFLAFFVIAVIFGPK